MRYFPKVRGGIFMLMYICSKIAFSQSASDPVYIPINSDLREVATLFPGYTFTPRNIFAKKSNPFKPNIKPINLTQPAASEGQLIIHVINSKEDFEKTLSISQKVRASYLFAKGSGEINYKAEKFYNSSSIIISFKFYAEYQDIGYNFGIDDLTDDAKDRFFNNPKTFVSLYGTRYIYAAKTAMYTNLILKINDVSELERNNFFLKVEGGADIKAFSGSASNEISLLLKKASTQKSYDYFSTFHGGVGIPDDANIITGALDKQDPIQSIKDGLNGVLKTFKKPNGEPDPKEVGYFVGKFEDMGLNMNTVQDLWNDYKEDLREKVAEQYYDALTVQDEAKDIVNNPDNPKRILLSEKQIQFVETLYKNLIPLRINNLIDLHAEITKSQSASIATTIEDNKTVFAKLSKEYLDKNIPDLTERLSFNENKIFRLIYYRDDTQPQIDYYLMVETSLTPGYYRVLFKNAEIKPFLELLKTNDLKSALAYFPLLRFSDIKNVIIACKISNIIALDQGDFYRSNTTSIISTPTALRSEEEWRLLYIYNSEKNINAPTIQMSVGSNFLGSFVYFSNDNKLRTDTILDLTYLPSSGVSPGPLVGLPPASNITFIYTDDKVEDNPEVGISFTNILGKKINIPLMEPVLEKNLTSIQTFSVPVSTDPRKYVINGEKHSVIRDQEVWAKKNGFVKEGDFYVKRNYIFNSVVRFSKNLIYTK